MDQYTLQSYFTSLCDAYYIAYSKKNRILKEDEELKKTDKTAEIKVIEQLKELHITDEIKKKYFSEGFSKEELGEIQKRLQEEQEEYKKKKDKINKDYSYLRQQIAGLEKQIVETVKEVEENGYTIIITSKKQIIPLISLFYKTEISGTRVINMEEEFLKLYPTGDKLCEKFFKAYSSENNEMMIQLYTEYF